MKKSSINPFKPSIILGFLFFFCMSFTGKAQYYTIPDTNFVVWLTSDYPSCMNNNQLDTTCSEILNETNLYIPIYYITSVDGIQFFDNLDTLYLANMQLSSLPRLPNGLENLICSGLQLPVLPDLPNSLKTLNCSYNNLTSLPVLPDSLRLLECGFNQLTTLPDLPDSLNTLACSNNQLSNLPILHEGIKYVDNSFNLFTSLSDLPSSLEVLYCYNNQLDFLSNIPEGLQILDCHSNLLTYLPDLPDTVDRLVCSYNQIQCFEWLPYVNDYVEITDNSFTCVPNVTAYSQGYPLCEFNNPQNNPNNCTSFNGIHGNIFKDQTDCIANGNELDNLSIPIRLYDNNDDFVALSYSNSAGEYFFPCDSGTYHVKLDSSILSITSYCYADTTLDVSWNLIDNVNFFIDCGNSTDLGINGIIPTGLVFPGQIHQLSVFAGYSSLNHVLNCFQNVSGSVTITIDGPVSYESASGSWIPSVINGNTFTYNIPDFSQVDFNDAFILNLFTDTTTQSGDFICATAVIDINGIDINPLNDTLLWCYEAINSYDPNCKKVYPDRVPNAFENDLIYTIQFQNTGTAPAINIRLEDTLSSYLNIETFELLQSSHQVITSLYGDRLVFRFNNIQLADSLSDEPGSHGFVQYRIKPISGLPVGTIIPNTASIYFDYNAPIVTNTATTTYSALSVNQVEANGPIIYPNPSSGLYHVKFNGSIEEINVFNLSGEHILQQQNLQNSAVIDLGNQPAGVYLLKMNQEDQTHYIRLVKL